MARTSGGEDRAVNVNDGNARTATVSGLNSNTSYTISVAAVTSAGTGPATSINVETPGRHVVYVLIHLKTTIPTIISSHQVDSLCLPQQIL